jgi:hypothetical protein
VQNSTRGILQSRLFRRAFTGDIFMRIVARLAVTAAVLCIPALAFAAGAIAVDDDVGDTKNAGYGVSTGQDSREEAASAAMRKCRAEGNRNCKVVVRFDTCGAYANSRKNYGVGWGESERVARAKALDACGENCSILVSDCE